VRCASKASTIASGNKWLYQGAQAGLRPEEAVAHWSGGAYQDNLDHFKQVSLLCRAAGAADTLLAQLEEEIARFERPGATRNRRYLPQAALGGCARS